jgi:U3 small nucleolar RNA-associated protein 3
MAKGTTPKRATRASARNKGGHESWMDDEVDEHHRSRDKISLDPDADSDDDDDAFDEGAGVMDIEADDDSDEDDDSDDEEDDEDEDDEDDEEDDEDDADVPAGDDSDDGEEEAALIKAMRAQQRRLDARGATRRTADDDDLDASASDSDDEAAGIRGSKKDDFYGDDDVDHEGQSDEEERADEEREARRLQRAAADGMDAGDFDAFSDESDEDDDASDSERETLGAKARALANQGAEKKKEKKGKKSAKNEGAAVESLGRDAVAAAASDAVASDAPELIALTKELTKTLDEITQSVEPVIAAARAGELATAEGISYLDAKHLLMLSYCINIVFYLLLKSEGRSVRDHPVVLRLVEIRAYLEKLRPIDKKLKYQIDKLLKMADGPRNEKGLGEGEDEDEDDPLRFKPNPDALVGKTDEEEGVNAGGAYRPPKMVPTAMDDFEEGGKSAKQKRKEKEARRRASRSALIKVRRMTTFPPTNIPRLVFGLGFFLPLNFLGLRRAFVGTPLHGDRRRPFLVAHSARTKSWAGYRPPRRGRLSNQELDSLSFSFSFRRRRKRRRFAHRSPRHLPRRLASVTKT